MATKTVTLSSTAYTKLDTGTDTALDMQNVSDSRVRVIFKGSLPGVDDTDFYILKSMEGVSRDGKTGDMYALSKGPSAVVEVTVGE